MSPVRLITVGLGSYANEPGWDLPGIKASRDHVAEQLAAHGAQVEDWTASAVHRAPPGSPDISQRLKDWRQGAEEGCFVYWSGHAEYSDDGYFLALADSTDPLDAFSGLHGRVLAEAVDARQRRRSEDRQADWIVLVLDTCGSSQGARRIWESLKDLYPNTAVIGTSASDGTASAGAFAQILQRHLENGFPNEEAIQVDELLHRLEKELNRSIPGSHVHKYFLDTALLPRRRNLPPPGLTTTVDLYAELREVLAKATETVRDHFFAKAQGAEINELAWHFTGRAAERRQIARWLAEGPPGMYVVSGVAGSGKSALLGMVLASSDPKVLSALEVIGYPAPDADQCPPPEVFKGALHLSGLTVNDAIAALATALDLPGVTDADELTRAVRRQGASDGPPATLLIDALDESRDALTIAGLLRRLATGTRLRLLVGTRQSLHEDPDHPQPPDRYILDSLGATQHNTLILGREPKAIHDYVDQRLRSRLGPEVSDARIRELADRIVAVEDQPFLFARLAAYEIAANPVLVGSDTDLDALLSGGHSGIFGHAVARLRAANPNVEFLLHALAYARGNGFPQTGRIWEVAGSALARQRLTDPDVTDTITAAAPYLLQGVEFGDTTYRLAHRTFTDWYRRNDANS